MSAPAPALLRDFLLWVAERPRTYAEAMDAWRSSCPRMTIWEDAILDGLVEVQRGESMAESLVVLTSQGRMIVESQAS